jgi:hypothetical protein
MADYTDLRGRFVYKRAVYWTELDTLAENDAHLKENGWEDGCKALFFQAAAPTGWTKDTTSVLDGRMLRVVSGSGGSTGGGSQMIGSSIILAHTHTLSNESDHSHNLRHFHQWAYVFMKFGSYLSNHLCLNGGKVWCKSGAGSNNSVYVPASPSTDCGNGGTHNHGGIIGSALSNIELAYVDTIVCSRDLSSGYTDQTSIFAYGNEINDPDFSAFGENDQYNKVRLIDYGTVMLFGSPSSPTNWTKLVTVNDKTLRIVTGTGGGTGGIQGISSALTLAHNAHAVSSDGDHTHSIPNHAHPYWWSGYNSPGGIHASFGKVAVDSVAGMLRFRGNGASTYNTLDDTTATDGGGGTSGSSGTHIHSLTSSLTNISLKYMDIIQCTKDVYDTTNYTDMSLFFGPDNLLAWQEMESLSQNDEWINNNQIPIESVSFFYQDSSPTTWTKYEDINDRALRVVSGDGAGVGGTNGISTEIALVHTHILNNPSHQNSVPAHTHAFKETSDTTTGEFMDWWVTADDPESNPRMAPTYIGGGGTSWENGITGISSSFSGGVSQMIGNSGNHGGTTGSSGTNITLAYANVIRCSKN